MPRLWNETIEAHRHAVRDATLDATEALVAERGLMAVTMSQIAEKTGIGRATLYKYFPDVEAVLAAWHERQVGRHLDQLAEVRDRAAAPAQRLADVLETYAFIAHEMRGRHDGELAALLHRDPHVTQAQHHLRAMIQELLAEAAAAGAVRDDATPEELAGYCLHALTAARTLTSRDAVRRLVTVTMAGLQPQSTPAH